MYKDDKKNPEIYIAIMRNSQLAYNTNNNC